VAEHALAVDVLGIGVLGPGLAGWAATRAVLRGEAPYASAATAIPPPQRLPATERRRAGTIIKVSIVAADEALAASGGDSARIATVFSASEGDGRNCHEICEALASSDRLISPTRFTNSVHNAPAGYWHIATRSMAASTSVCAYDASFAMGLLEAALQARLGPNPVLLVVADAPYPEPLHAARPLPDSMAIALVLGRAASHRARARLTIQPWRASDRERTRSRGPVSGARPPEATDGPLGAQQARGAWGPELDALSRALPVAWGLPLLEALARDDASACGIDAFDDLSLHVGVEPAR
jgi:hypothetical protein